ncbi:DUF4138 domain-containing protein [Aequorivita antarctica]|uniref:DUF4138 domain-containing protein n=1 Tax=Aequorivita antarctica TaxID=153266 RepID=A0A5C6Z1S9_9FLAO|nr:DUF4138 domain-containing protein [Aequorivita antarctica]TXD73298.1 DUF4138 domain-containing protein [Aequorivita antarctica]SRX74718.1 hypothetical protein AEQU3_01698 [Aequorivita antarctica]
MKNSILFASLFLASILLEAQNITPMDTIFANDQKNVSLFFPNPVRQGIVGSDNFVFTYNREKEQYFGLLQAKPGKPSNLLIINSNGSIFTYIISYKEQLEKLNYFIPQSENIGFEQPRFTESSDSTNVANLFTDKTFYYERFCSFLLTRKQHIGNIQKRKNGIVLSLENIVFDKEELYFVIKIENKSSLDYDLNFLDISTQTRKQGKKKSIQRISQHPNFKYNVPTKVGEKEIKRMVYVLPKFSLSNDKMIVLELNEKNGERNIKMKVSNKYINNPN